MQKGKMTFWLLAAAFVAALLLPEQVEALDPGRFLQRAQDRAERNVERRLDQIIDRKVNEVLDSAEEGPGSRSGNDRLDPAASEGVRDQVVAAPVAELSWSRFDFVPGDIIIFEDNQEGERNGEFPRKWDLANGSVENAVLNGENVIMFLNTNTNSDGGIVPMLANSDGDYLPDEFTIEFDAYFDSPRRTYRVLFYDGKNQRRLNNNVNRGSNAQTDRVRVSQNSAVFGSTYGYYPGFNSNTSQNETMSLAGWRRVSISFNQRALKVYLDDARVLNIPNMNYNPLGITMAYHNPNGGHQGYIKNIRIAKGAVPLYDKFLTDGKIVTSGIRFDVNKATIRPESMGVINEIVQLMQQHPELSFSVEGHTDSDGSTDLNQRLSEERARAVTEKMIEMGIAKERLRSTGYGQSRPIAPNNTPEGKAQNRRVEFIKI
ncbi:OmpA family protein [Desulfonatronovibrio magnus]|uniref:OmpA family protein n=1 Tax=Desulfonatronovibrio magnus TaxID=698827 RepID=UPI000695AEFF|nr:OmpA family protein [Desulfonatronovibrio magnus]